MQCPYCNGEMKMGYVQSPKHWIFWGEEKPKIFNVFITPSSNNDIVLSKGFFNAPAVESYCCKECKKIIIGF